MARAKSWIQQKRATEKRIHWLAKEAIPKIHETISPAPKSEELNEIESLKEAMKYYEPYCDKICIQKKYMGSYCLMVLHRDHNKSYFVSRNGNILNYLKDENGDKDPKLLNKVSVDIHEKVFSVSPYLEWVLVEAELMPWRLLGAGLVDVEYGGYGHLHSSHLETLKESSILDKISKLREDRPWDRDNLKSHESRQYKALRDFNMLDLEEYSNMIDLYNEQLELYGSESNIEFKPFNVIVGWTFDGESFFPENQIFIGEYNDAVVLPSTDYENAYKFFESMKDQKAEGIMVKPLKQRLINIAPALKVRTNEYLQLIYGVNFNKDFDYFFEKRNVKYKLIQSIKQFENNIRMTSIHPEHIPTSELYKKLCYTSLDAERFNKTLDHRL